MPEGSSEDQRLTRKEIGRLVHNWIGVNGGYLGNFSYAAHDRFWMEVCDLDIDTGGFPGTTRACFEDTLHRVSARDQAAALRAILDEYPAPDEPDPNHPRFRTPSLSREIGEWINRLETGEVPIEVSLASASDIVRRGAR